MARSTVAVGFDNGTSMVANSITNRQLFFILLMTLTSNVTVTLPNISATAFGRSGWIPILTVSLFTGIAVVFIVKLNNMNRGKVFFDYSKQIVGKFISYAISIYYLFYFFIISVFLNYRLDGLIKTQLLQDTPSYALLMLSIPLMAYGAYKGITNLARLFEIIGIIFIAVTVLLSFVMLTQGMNYNVLPLYHPKEAKQFLPEFWQILTPFGGIEALFIIPFTQINKKASKVGFLTLLFIGLFYVLIVESTIMILGINNTILLSQAQFEGMKLIKIPVIQRADLLFVISNLTGELAGMFISFICVLEFACKLCPKCRRNVMAIIIGVFSFAATLLTFRINNMADIFKKYIPYLIMLAAFIIPSAVFLIAKIKGCSAKLAFSEGREVSSGKE